MNLTLKQIENQLKQLKQVENLSELRGRSVEEKAAQRLGRLGVGVKGIKSLLGKNIVSAYQVASLPFNTFVSQHGSSVSHGELKTIYRKAQGVKNRLVLLWINMYQHHHPGLPVMLKSSFPSDVAEFLPDYEDLFGSLDYLDVDHDESVLSASAYLVDLLRVATDYVHAVLPSAIDAAINLPDNETVCFFNGNRVYTCNWTKKSIDSVESIENKFPGLKGVRKIDAITSDIGNSDKAYVFVGDKYYKIYLSDDDFGTCTSNSYPQYIQKEQSDTGFSSHCVVPVSFAFNCDGYNYFCNDDKFSKRESGSKVWDDPKLFIDEQWPAEIIGSDAVLNDVTDNNIAWFFKNGECLKVDLDKKELLEEADSSSLLKTFERELAQKRLLSDRRPDIFSIELDKENINNTVPFVNYINQLLLKKTGDTKALVFPFQFPFCYPLNQSKAYLSDLGYSLSDLLEAGKTEQQREELDPSSQALAVLNLSPNDLSVIFEAHSQSSEIENYFGKAINDLVNYDTFLEQTGLDWKQAEALFTRGLSEEELAKYASDFYINKGMKGAYWVFSKEKGLSLSNNGKPTSYLPNIDRIHRFIRLAMRMQWSFAELEQVLLAVGNDDDSLGVSVLPSLTNFSKLSAKVDLPVMQLAALFGTIQNTGSDNLFECLFDCTFPEFEAKEDKDSAVAAAFKIGKDELMQIQESIDFESDDVYSLKGISAIFQVAALLKQFDWTLAEYSLAQQLLAQSSKDGKLNVNLTLTDVLKQVALKEWMEESGFYIQELSFILFPGEISEQGKTMVNSLIEFIRNKLSALPAEEEKNGGKQEQELLAELLGSFFQINPDLVEMSLRLSVYLSGKKNDDILALLCPVQKNTAEEDENDVLHLAAFIQLFSRVQLLLLKTGLTKENVTTILNNQTFFDLNADSSLKQIQNLYEWKQLVDADPDNELDAYIEEHGFKQVEELLVAAAEDLLLQNIGADSSFPALVEEALKKGKESSLQSLAEQCKSLCQAQTAHDDWDAKIKTVEGKVQEIQRDCLVAKLMIDNGLSNDREVSEYLLMDVEMGSNSDISPVKEATLAVQTYLNRIHMGLEIDLTVEIPDVWWPWLMSYREWEANRKVFLYPENYLEPSLRTDKTELFQTLEQKLTQGEISSDMVEEAYTDYFKSLMTLGNLKHIAACQAQITWPNSTDAIETLFNFARTDSDSQAFYCQLCFYPSSDNPEWQEWKAIPLPIDADAITPVYAFNKLFVFWVEKREITQTNNGGGDEQSKLSKQKTDLYSVKYAFENIDGTWSPVQTIMDKQAIPKAQFLPGNIYSRVGLIYNSNAEKLTIKLGEDADCFLYEMDDLLQVEPIKNKLIRGMSREHKKAEYGTMGSIGDYVLFATYDSDLKVEIFENKNGDFIASGVLTVDPHVDSADKKGITNIVTIQNFVLFLMECDNKKVACVYKLVNDQFEYLQTLEIFATTGYIYSAVVGSYVVFAGDKDHMVVYKLENGYFKSQPNIKETNMISVVAALRNYLFCVTTEYESGNHFLISYQLKNGVFIEQETIALGNGLPAIATVKDFVLLGGDLYSRDKSDTIDVYKLEDGVLKKQDSLQLSSKVGSLASANIGDYIVFTGDSDNRAIVDNFKIENDSFKKQDSFDIHNMEYLPFKTSCVVNGDHVFIGGSVDKDKYDAANAIVATDIHPPGTWIDVLTLTTQLSFDTSQDVLAPCIIDNQLQFCKRKEEEAQFDYHGFENLDYLDGFSILGTIDSEKDHAYSLIGDSTCFSFESNGQAYLLQGNGKIDDDLSIEKVKRLSTRLIPELGMKLVNGGIDALLTSENQQLQEASFLELNPDNTHVKSSSYPPVVLDFYGNYGIYFRELFFHIPMMIASSLQQEGQYRDAQKWYHYVFNPTDQDGQYWKFLPFQSLQQTNNLKSLLQNENTIKTYNDDPFDPYAIANLRQTAFQKNVVMSYLDNLLLWGDACFAEDTWESIAEASTLYFTAWDIMGKRPESEGRWKTPDPVTFADIQKAYQSEDTEIPQFFIDLELLLSETDEKEYPEVPFNNLYAYFGVGQNSQLASYWDQVEDRLYKIRNSQNIKGVYRALSLYEPAIDPMSLVRAVSNGQSPADLLNSSVSASCPYRFEILLERAKSVTTSVTRLGAALLNALEKQDAENLDLIRSSYGIQNENLIRTIKQNQIELAKSNLERLQESLNAAQSRKSFYTTLISNGLNSAETASIVLQSVSAFTALEATAMKGLAAATRIAPNVFGLADGGTDWGAVPESLSAGFDGASNTAFMGSFISSSVASYYRRREDWQFQKESAQQEIDQINVQIQSQNIQLKMAQQELSIFEQQSQQSKEINDFLQNKFTNKDLYTWQVSQISSLYYQSYRLAQQTALAAEKAYQSELNRDDTFISFEHWNSLKKGLLAGEGLLLDIANLEKAYSFNNKRLLEIEKVISLKQFMKEDFPDLTQSKQITFSFDNDMFDNDFRGHYNRRIKSVRITIPAVVGPYQNIYATLNQTKNTIYRTKDATPENGKVLSDYRSQQSIALSRGVNDAGLFVLNFNDSRYLPFEGTGVESSWELSFSGNTDQQVMESVSDIIVHLSYTAQS